MYFLPESITKKKKEEKRKREKVADRGRICIDAIEFNSTASCIGIGICPVGCVKQTEKINMTKVHA